MLDLAFMLAAAYLFWCVLVFLVGLAVVVSVTVAEWREDCRKLRHRLAEDAEVQALEDLWELA